MPPDTTPRRPRLERVFPTRPGAVPTPVFAPLLRELLDQPDAPTQTQLEARSGVPARTIYRVLVGADRSVSFPIADALLTALEAIHHWHEPPLDQFLPPPPDSSQLINPTTPSQHRARKTAPARGNHDNKEHMP
jgi:hypothetical protein